MTDTPLSGLATSTFSRIAARGGKGGAAGAAGRPLRGGPGPGCSRLPCSCKRTPQSIT